MIIDENEIGLGYGLNKGLKVGKFLKKNVRLKNVNLKNAIAVGSIAASFVPAGGVATKLATKLTKLGKVGKLAKGAIKLANTKVGKFVLNKAKQGIALNSKEANVVNQIAVAQDVDNSTPNVMTPEQFENASAGTGAIQSDAPIVSSAPVVRTNNTSVPNEAQIETLAKVKEIPKENLVEEAQNQQKEADSIKEAGTGAPKKDNTMLYVGIGAVAVVGIGLAMSKGSNSATTTK